MFRCESGYYFGLGRKEINFTCVGVDIWSTNWLPSRYMNMNKNQIGNLSEISCQSSCGRSRDSSIRYSEVAQWCLAVRSHLLNKHQVFIQHL